LRGGDAWDRQIRSQIHECRLFVPIVSANTEARVEGYFRREWRLAVDRTHDLSERTAFLLPVVIDSTSEQKADVPDAFRHVQWTRLPVGETRPAFVEQVQRLLTLGASSAPVVPTRVPLVAARECETSIASPRRHRLALWATGALVVTALGYLLADKFWTSKGITPSASTTSIGSPSQPTAALGKSVAVLPFVDMSEKHDQEYFADGMAEETLNQLAKLPGLKVIGRTSSFQFRGNAGDLRKIGAALGAVYVLEGSVRRSGNHLRVTAQLIEASSGTHRWSQTFDRSTDDVLQIQDEIALGLARALQIEIGSSAPERRTPNSLEAYERFLRGLHAREQFNRPGMEEAIADFKQALSLDARLVSAEEQLAVTQWDMSAWGFILPGPGYKEARDAAERALAIDSNSGTAHAVLCELHTKYDWEWVAARRECDVARKIAPQTPYVLNSAANLQMALGDWDAAIEFIEAALAADPLDPRISETIGQVYVRAGRNSDAEQAFRRLIAISPTYVFAHCELAIVLLDGGRAEEALSEANRETESFERHLGLAVVNHAMNRTRAAEEALTALQAEAPQLWPMGIAEANAFLGHKDRAFEWLNRAFEEKDSTLYWIQGDPLMRSLQGDPRYRAFLRRMNLPAGGTPDIAARS
jgi:TolB-like protein/Tfp pilus assembly protein PilF